MIACVTIVVRYAMAIAGVFAYRNSGPDAMALCILIDGAGLGKLAMNGGIASVMIITIDRRLLEPEGSPCMVADAIGLYLHDKC